MAQNSPALFNMIISQPIRTVYIHLDSCLFEKGESCFRGKALTFPQNQFMDQAHFALSFSNHFASIFGSRPLCLGKVAVY